MSRATTAAVGMLVRTVTVFGGAVFTAGPARDAHQ